MLTGDRTILETVVNVATSMPFVLVGLQTPRLVNILFCFFHAEAKKLIDLPFEAVFFSDWSTGCLLIQFTLCCVLYFAGKSLPVECMETQLSELELPQACITHLVEMSERSSASATTP